MLKNIFITILTFAVAVSALPLRAVNVRAAENEYAITSELNGGWQTDNVESKLVAYADFGIKSEFSGMKAEIGDDASAASVSSIMGREGWVITPNKGNNARYINIDVDDDIAHNVVDGQSFAVEVDYFDGDDLSSLSMEYDSMNYQPISMNAPSGDTSQPVLNNAYVKKEGEYLIFNNTGVWRSYSWFMDNPKFGGGLDGYDLRVGIYSESMGFSRGGEVVISAIRIYKLNTKSRVEITSDTSTHIGNIFFDGEEIELNTKFSSCIYPHFNQTDGEYPLEVVYTVRNEDGFVIHTETDSFTLPVLSERTRTVKFRVDKYDIYRVDIEAYCNEKQIYSRCGTEFSYVRSDKGKTLNPKTGIQIGLLNPRLDDIALLTRYAGIPNVRMMCYYYNWRTSAEQYEPTNVSIAEGYRTMFRSFKKAGLEIDANLHSASWMGAAYNFSPIERTPPYTEDGLRRWAEYCSMMAELIGDSVDQFEIWNEYNLGPNHSFNMENRPASDYAKMYEVSKEAIKSVNPDIPVIGLNTSGAPVAWIEDVLKAGATDMDVLSIHPYQWYGDPLTFNSAEKNIKPIAELFNKYGMEDIPIWITEYGYSSNYENVNSEYEQGLYNIQAYALIMATEEIDRYYFFCLLNKQNGVRSDRESNFGIVRDRETKNIPYKMSYAAKPGYLMISNLNMMYHDAEYMDTIELGNTGRVIRSRHTTDGKQFAMMFSNKPNGELVTLNLGTDKITLYDAYGNAEDVYGEKGIFSFDLSKRVQYIEGDFKSFERAAGGVFPAKTEIDAVYGKDAQIPIVNYSGHTVYAKAEPLGGSETDAGEKVISGEKETLTVKGGNAVSGTERVRLTLYDDERVYFSGYIYLAYKEQAHMTTTLIPLDDGWSMRCTLENLSPDSAVNGTLRLLTPAEWRGIIPDTAVSLEKGETKSIDVKLPVPLVSDDKTIEMGFVIDENNSSGSYVSKSYNFSAAQKADSPIVIDGEGDEWTGGFMTLNRNDQFHSLLSLGSTYAGPEDLSAKAAIKYDDDNFYMFADVTDNIHFSTGVTPVNIWQMDSIQVALVYDPENKLGRTEFEEFAIGEIDGKTTIYRHKTRFSGDGDYTKIDGSELAVSVKGQHTYYELKIPWSSLMVEQVKIEPGTELKFSMVVNENDGVGRVGYMAFGDGIVSSKNSNLFKRLYIRG